MNDAGHDAELLAEGRLLRATGGRRRRRVALVLAVLLPPVIVRGCILDDYVIESSSMEPAFHGAPEGGDHLLVLRRGCDSRPVQRWDVEVIDGSVDPELPHDIGAMLKRVVGLPGESLYVANGDIYASRGDDESWGSGSDGGGSGASAPQLARKPDELIAALLVPMCSTAGLAAPWTWVGPGECAELPEGGTRVSAGATSGTAVFEGVVDDGLPGAPGETPVSDTALQVEVGACDGVLELQLREGADVFTARLAAAARGGAWLHHNLGGGVVATAPDFPGLHAGQTVLLWNVDNGVRLRIDGRTLLAWDYDANGTQVAGAPHNDPWLAVEGGAIVLRRVTVLRDLHFVALGVYGSDSQAPFHVPGGHLFLLGDHSRQSRDSRFFGPVPLGAVRGRPLAIYSPWSRARWLGAGGQPR